jgi:hypothetical protein
MGFYRARTPGNISAYAKADSLAEVFAGFARVRKPHSFILTPSALAGEQIICVFCHERIEPEQANRGTYSPSRQRATVLHYECSNENTQSQVLGVS